MLCPVLPGLPDVGTRVCEPEMITCSVELTGLRRLRTEGLGLQMSAGALRSSAAMFE